MIASTGCFVPGGDSDVPDVALQTPQITEITFSCDADKGKWTLRLEANSWTGGATLYWSDDGFYVESHALRSINAAQDGTSDVLEVEVTIAADWRVDDNSTTAFTCGHEPSAEAVIYDQEGIIADCARFGYQVDLISTVDGVPTCSAIWESAVFDAFDTGVAR